MRAEAKDKQNATQNVAVIKPLIVNWKRGGVMG